MFAEVRSIFRNCATITRYFQAAQMGIEVRLFGNIAHPLPLRAE